MLRELDNAHVSITHFIQVQSSREVHLYLFYFILAVFFSLCKDALHRGGVQWPYAWLDYAGPSFIDWIGVPVPTTTPTWEKFLVANRVLRDTFRAHIGFLEMQPDGLDWKYLTDLENKKKEKCVSI